MERKITKALPTMIEKSTDQQLAHAFSNHLEETRGHVAKVESLLRDATGEADTATCKAIGSLITEAEDNIKDAGDESIRDITLIASAQQVEHHEMAVYGTLRNWAELLGQTEAARYPRKHPRRRKEGRRTPYLHLRHRQHHRSRNRTRLHHGSLKLQLSN